MKPLKYHPAKKTSNYIDVRPNSHTASGLTAISSMVNLKQVKKSNTKQSGDIEKAELGQISQDQSEERKQRIKKMK